MTLDPASHPRCVHTERLIAAPIEHVWSVLVDFECYPEWNPFTFGVTTGGVVGGPVTLRVKLGRTNLTMHERLTRWDEGRAVAWGLRWGRGVIIDCDRVQSLARVDEHTTLYRCHEAFDGLLAPLVYGLYRGRMQVGFEAAAEALAVRCATTFS
jgi:hypothetical protein